LEEVEMQKMIVGGTLLLALVVGGCSQRTASTPAPSPTPAQATSVTVVMREFEFEPKPLKVKAGTVRFLLINRGTVEHDFAIPSLEAHGEREQHLVQPGKTREVELETQAGLV
jgi:plastocyanin